LGKRGPKLGEGGRPIIYHDQYHEVTRRKTRELRIRKRLAELSDNQEAMYLCMKELLENENITIYEAEERCHKKLGVADEEELRTEDLDHAKIKSAQKMYKQLVEKKKHWLDNDVAQKKKSS
jgi:hypothetical protein